MIELPEGITEENRPDWMTDEYLRRQEWANEERELIDEVRDEIIDEALRHDEVGIAQWGTKVSNDGNHRVNFTLEVQGSSVRRFWRKPGGRMSDTENSDGERPDPEDDPSACSICGCHIGQFTGEYCDGCAREIGVKPPLRRCVECGQEAPEEQMVGIDVSPPDEYYPTFEYLCRGCSHDTGIDREEGSDHE